MPEPLHPNTGADRLTRVLRDDPRLVGVLVAVLILVGAALRFYALGMQSLWYDEVNGMRIAGRSFADIWVELTADASPPLFYLCMRGWLALFGDTAAAARSFAATVGVATLPVIYVVAARLFDRRVGVLGLFLAAVSQYHVYYCQEARMYTMLALFGILAVFCLHEAVRSRGVAWWALYVLWTSLALYTHNYGVFIALSGAGYVGARACRGERGTLKSFLAAAAAVGVLYLPWLLFALKHQVRGTAIRGGWLHPLQPTYVWETFAWLTSIHMFGINGVVLWLILPVLVLCIGACFLSVRRTDGRWRARVVGGSAGAILFCYGTITLAVPMLISILKPIYLPYRYSAAVWPAVPIVLGCGIARLRRRSVQAAVLVALGTASVLALSWHFTGMTRATDRDIADFIAKRMQRQDVIIFAPHWAGVTLSYYLGDLPHQLGFPSRTLANRRGHNEALEREPRSLEEILALTERELAARGGRLFLVRNPWAEQGLTLSERLAERYRLVDGTHMEYIKVSVYERAAAPPAPADSQDGVGEVQSERAAP